VLGVLRDSEMFWLSTVRRTGQPPVTPLPAVWDAGALHIATGDQEQKAVNLAREPRCVLTTGTNTMNAGLDVVVEGTAVPITEHARLVELAALWKSKLDWDFAVDETGFTDGQGRHPVVYAVAPEKILVFGKKPFTQSRVIFPSSGSRSS
jgi:pyridoxamine 5'-phosphate oxidase-like protein